MMRQGWKGVLRAWGGALFCAGALVACGGGGGDAPDARTASMDGDYPLCPLSEQKRLLDEYMRDWYYFADQAPRPGPLVHDTLEGHFYASLFTVADRTVASDHWSYVVDEDLFDAYFEEGKDFGYGLLTTMPEWGAGPVRIQHVTPGSPAARAGLLRGQQVITVNGRAVASLSERDFLNALYPLRAGQALSLEVWNAGRVQVVRLVADDYPLMPVERSAVIDSPGGKKAAYIRLDNFVDLAQPELDARLRVFAAQAVTQDALILDLRYDGGGSLWLANWLVSQIAGQGVQGQVMAQVRYNRMRAAQMNDETLFGHTDLPGWKKVYVLTGPGTCSASEYVINVLKPYVQVVQIGGTTCGKPFGFEPVFMPEGCPAKAINAVNFETFNRDGEGRYYAGLSPTCAVPDDLDHRPGDPAEALTQAALAHLDTGSCPPTGGARMVASGPHRALSGGGPAAGAWRHQMWRR